MDAILVWRSGMAHSKELCAMAGRKRNECLWRQRFGMGFLCAIDWQWFFPGNVVAERLRMCQRWVCRLRGAVFHSDRASRTSRTQLLL